MSAIAILSLAMIFIAIIYPEFINNGINQHLVPAIRILSIVSNIMLNEDASLADFVAPRYESHLD